MGVRRSGPIQAHALDALVAKLVFLIPSLDRAPSLSSDPPTPDSLAVVTAPTPPQPELDKPHRAPAVPRRSGPSCWPAPPAPASGACGRGGLRASMRPSHEPAGTPLRAAQRATALAPMISKRRSSRSPILDVLPSRSLPPLER